MVRLTPQKGESRFLAGQTTATYGFNGDDLGPTLQDGASPAPNETGLTHTVVVRPGETVRIIMRFTDHADPDTAYIDHCHLWKDEAHG
jgi:FtsP/CotA-like multicopper oxidase with cupredoxin domain